MSVTISIAALVVYEFILINAYGRGSYKIRLKVDNKNKDSDCKDIIKGVYCNQKTISFYAGLIMNK